MWALSSPQDTAFNFQRQAKKGGSLRPPPGGGYFIRLISREQKLLEKRGGRGYSGVMRKGKKTEGEKRLVGKLSRALGGSAPGRKLRTIKNRLFLPAFLKAMKRLKIGGLSGGNRLTLLSDGDRCFDEFLRAMKRARLSINLETYIFNSDDLGWRIARLLVEKARQGVEVNFIYDAVGCLGTSPSLFAFLKEGGVEVIEYHPFWPWRRFWNISFRDHRKILVVDGRIAFVGGMNIGLEYAGRRFRGDRWRDTHLKITGPAVRDIQFNFLENWYRCGGAVMDSGRHFPRLRELGNKLVMVLGSRTRRNLRPIRESYLSAIRYARESIWISNAYFVPDRRIFRALIRAAARGVDVRVLLPVKSDVPLVKFASRYLYKRYLKGGIRVCEYQPSVLHAKTAVIDGIWSTVGSSNLDRRSFRKNLEINAVVLDQEFGEEMERVFLEDLDGSEELTLEHWEKRSLWHLLLEWICYRFRNLL